VGWFEWWGSLDFKSNWPLALAGHALAAIVFDVIEKAPGGAFCLSHCCLAEGLQLAFGKFSFTRRCETAR
ncbi:MAG: hypothetical protein KA752_01790, partial [Giesbergeria sp.]|nr:hypothetical protein [Giesbergeria sp.]